MEAVLRAYPFLDSPVQQLIDVEHSIYAYCRCGRYALLKPDGLMAQHPNSTLHRLVAKLRCSGCQRLGDIECVTVSPMGNSKIVGGVTGR